MNCVPWGGSLYLTVGLWACGQTALRWYFPGSCVSRYSPVERDTTIDLFKGLISLLGVKAHSLASSMNSIRVYFHSSSTVKIGHRARTAHRNEISGTRRFMLFVEICWAYKIHIAVFWVMAQCRLISKGPTFRENRHSFHPEDGSRTFLQNAGTHLSDYTVLQSRTHSFSWSWKTSRL